jgi:hypothetical protein
MKTDFLDIFKTLRAALQVYSAKGFDINLNNETDFELYTSNPVTAFKKNEKLYFAGAKILKNHVAFYFMPIYISPEIKLLLHPELLKILKGKSCFHIKKLDENLENYLSKALEIGFLHYKQNGWN